MKQNCIKESSCEFITLYEVIETKKIVKDVTSNINGGG